MKLTIIDLIWRLYDYFLWDHFSTVQLIDSILMIFWKRRWSFGWGLIFIFWDLSIGLGSCCSPLSGSAYPSPTVCTKPQSMAWWYLWFSHWCWVFWFVVIVGLAWRVQQVYGITGDLCRLSEWDSKWEGRYLYGAEVTSGIGRVLGLSGSFKIHINKSIIIILGVYRFNVWINMFD